MSEPSDTTAAAAKTIRANPKKSSKKKTAEGAAVATADEPTVAAAGADAAAAGEKHRGDDLASALKAKKCKRAVPAAAEPTAESADVEKSSEETFGRREELPANVNMCMRTLQASQWRTLADALKDLVPACPVEFDAKGMRLVSMDPSHVAMIHLQALSEFFYCRAPITIGLNIAALYKMLRNLTTSGYMLEFVLTDDAPEFLHITITNGDKKTITKNSLKLLRLSDESYEIPQTIFHRVLSIPSTDFQRYVRELSAISKKITVRSTKNVLELSAYGSDGSTSIEIKPTPSGMHWTHIQPPESANDDVIEGVFLSKYLERFARPLDNVVEIFLKPDYPLVIRYIMPTATVRLVIGQIKVDDEGGEIEMDDDI